MSGLLSQPSNCRPLRNLQFQVRVSTCSFFFVFVYTPMFEKKSLSVINIMMLLSVLKGKKIKECTLWILWPLNIRLTVTTGRGPRKTPYVSIVFGARNFADLMPQNRQIFVRYCADLKGQKVFFFFFFLFFSESNWNMKRWVPTIANSWVSFRIAVNTMFK